MRLAVDGILQQGGAPATATLTYELYTGGFAGTFKIYKNGVLYQTMTTDTSLVTVTINAGDTFYATCQCNDGCGVDYYVNGSYVTSYYPSPLISSLVTTPTVTSTGGTTYKYTASFGAV